MKLPSGCYEAGDLLDAFPQEREPIIQGVLRRSEIANICAGTKTHKSWLVLDTGLSIATGRPWLGKFPVTRGRVLMLDYELQRETTANRLRTIAKHRGIERSEYEGRLFFHNLRGTDTHDITELQQYLQAFRKSPLTLVVVDALYRALPSDCTENDAGHMRQVYHLLDLCAADTGASVIVVHHTSKGSQAEKSVTDRGSGTGVLSRVVDSHLTLTPHADGKAAVLEAALRTWPEMDPVGLKWDGTVWQADDSLDVRKLKTGRTGRDVRQSSLDAETDCKIVEKLLAAAKPLTNRGISTATGFTTARVTRGLERLLHAGKVVPSIGTYRGQECVFYSLSP